MTLHPSLAPLLGIAYEGGGGILLRGVAPMPLTSGSEPALGHQLLNSRSTLKPANDSSAFPLIMRKTMSALKPALNRGFPLPIEKLSPEAFEDFVYQALSVLGEQKGFEMQSGRQPSADQGFDCTAKTVSGGHLVCIQCKRYTSALSIKTVAEEIIKVSLEGALNTSQARQHYIITSGPVTGVLRTALRQEHYLDLKSECAAIINNNIFQPSLIKKSKEKNLSPIDITKKYIDDLEKLIVWSSIDFNNELLVSWSKLDDVLERNFTIERVLKDKPTPDFNLEKYLYRKTSTNTMVAPLSYTVTTWPPNLQSKNKIYSSNEHVLDVNHVIELLISSKNIVLSSSGGSGKSSTLSTIEQMLLKNDDLKYFPIKLKLRSYARQTLNDLINQELGITFGSWKSLPFRFVFLLDGLDEMLHSDTQAFCDELFRIAGEYSYIITLRHAGLSISTSLMSADTCLAIQPLSYRSALRMASDILTGEELNTFYGEYRNKLSSIGFNFFASPFVLSRSFDYYRSNKKLPESTEEILEDWILGKLTKDQTRITDVDAKLNRLPTSQIIETLSFILYKASFGLGLACISEEDLAVLMMECYDELSMTKNYVAKAVSFFEFTSLIKSFEILYKDDDNLYITPHQIIADYLSSKTLAKNWQVHKHDAFNTAHYDIWLYCSNLIRTEERKEFIETAFSLNPILGAEIARKFEGKFLDDIQDRLLALEQDEKVLTRSEAIVGLGLLGTAKCLNRLKSNIGCRDYQQFAQRRRALALNGSRETLFKILIENEPLAQGPGKISGGDYALWFQSPPTVITEIARDRIDAWLHDRQPFLRMSLRTIALFGDDTDIENLSAVLTLTDNVGEFFDAAKALLNIDKVNLIEKLFLLITGDNSKSYWAKQVLVPLGVECNTQREIDRFLSLAQYPQDDVSKIIHQVYEFHRFLCQTKINQEQVEKIISTYVSLTFIKDFYYRGLLWELGCCGSPGCLFPLVERAFNISCSAEIHYAMGYLARQPELNIDKSLSQKIDAYFDSLDEKHEGIFRNYVIYYNKHQTRSLDFGLSLMRQKTTEKLANLSPETISFNDYSLSLFEYDIVFDFLGLSVDGCSWIAEEDALKLLLINTDITGVEKKTVKTYILKTLDKAKLDAYVTNIKDITTRTHISAYMLLNDLSSTPNTLLKEYFPMLLSNHFLHETLAHSCARHWDDEVARLFLSHLCHSEWNSVTAQLFEQYTGAFLLLLTKDQMENFERARNAPINSHIDRTYRIFLESKGLKINASIS